MTTASTLVATTPLRVVVGSRLICRLEVRSLGATQIDVELGDAHAQQIRAGPCRKRDLVAAGEQAPHDVLDHDLNTAKASRALVDSRRQRGDLKHLHGLCRLSNIVQSRLTRLRYRIVKKVQLASPLGRHMVCNRPDLWRNENSMEADMTEQTRAAIDDSPVEVRIPVESMDVITRKPNAKAPESRYEKVVVVPNADDKSASNHAWADARFATDILSEHGLFFALLMPEELAKEERGEALTFYREFGEMHRQIAAAKPPEKSEVKPFLGRVKEKVKPFIEYKQRLGDAQRAGKLRSLVWPLFFDHTRHEAERWERRFNALSNGQVEFERKEVVTFWTNIMDEHARFVAHLLDPDEYKLIEKAFKTAEVFRELQKDGVAGAVTALAAQPGVVA
ncbi:MAG TPA: DUF2935 domain-containing protein, partial [Candidatus Limnocylindria bacterium]|nr:DUF2935 domain-containing protein [Candidatus Limnocylindria bacterium]